MGIIFGPNDNGGSGNHRFVVTMGAILAISVATISGAVVVFVASPNNAGLFIAGLVAFSTLGVNQLLTVLRQTSTEKEVKTALRNAECHDDISTHRAREKVQRVEDKLDIVSAVVDTTHALVKSKLMDQLRISAIALRRLADLTKTDEDNKAADTADRALAEHVTQEIADRGGA